MNRLLFYLMACGSAAYPATVISDGTFSSGWTFDLVNWAPSGGGNWSAYNVTTGGNPDYYRYEVHTLGSISGLHGYNLVSMYTLATFNPAIQGSITSLDFSFDLIQIGVGLWPGYGLAIEQNGRYYRYVDPSLLANSSSWVSHSRTGLTATSFVEILPNASTYAGLTDPLSHPDFSTSGAPLQFGYVVYNGYTDLIHGLSGIDNFNVTIDHNPVPEPSTYATVAGALSALAFMRHWRREHRLDTHR